MNEAAAPTNSQPARILHLGLSNFHRAHQVVYLQRLKEQGDTSWQLVGTNIRADANALLDALAVQDGNFTLETIDPNGTVEYEWITAIDQVLPYDAQLKALTKLAADPATRILSFTVTEAGYYLLENGELDTGFADLQADIERVKKGEPGQTIYGALVTLLRARKAADAGPITLQNCDNLRHNGDRVRGGLRDFCRRIGDNDILAWIDANVSFPNAMVDRITPRPAPELKARVKEKTGRDDNAALGSESYIQWVIEDSFANGRPAWEKVGAELVDSVDPYEEAKIRLLNAAHSCIAWGGTLRGHSYIHEGARDAVVRKLAYDYATEDVIPCLSGAGNPVNLPAYRDKVLERFGNDAIRDTNQRVTADSFSKIPGFILPTIRDRLKQDQSIDAVAMLPAMFLVFLTRWHEGKLPFEYHDQSMDPRATHTIVEADDPVKALVADRLLWQELAGDRRLEEAVRKALVRVQKEVLPQG